MIGHKVYGQGPMPCQTMLVGEGPGRQESIEGRPFCGASGIELEYLYLRRAARIRREDIYITNVVKWRTDEDDRDPTAEEIERDREELETEIGLCDPKTIVAVGRVAAEWFLQTNDVDLEKYHGTPVYCPRYPDKQLIIVYHPAAGLHQPERYLHQIYWDFQQVGRLVRGEIAPLDAPTGMHYSDIAPPSPEGASILPSGGPLVIAIDTEGSVERPWGLSFSYEEGKAFVLRGDGESPARDALRNAIRTGSVVVGHNLLHDVDVLDALQTPIDPSNAYDTMLEAYLLPHLPRRLKALSFKLLGVEQSEYEDITKEADEQIVKDYLTRVITEKRCTQCLGVGRTNKRSAKDPARVLKSTIRCEACGGDGTTWRNPLDDLVSDGRSHGIGRRVRTLLERGTGLRKRWAQTDDPLRSIVESELGPIREVTLDDISLDKAVHYSAADADCTLRVHNKLEPILRKEGLWRVYEIDKGILPIIHRMHSVGILVDHSHFQNLSTQFMGEQSTLGLNLSRLANKSINPSSPLQVGEVIYDTFNVKPFRGKRSTDEKTLETLKIKHKSDTRLCEFIDNVTDYRELDKLLGTYVIPLPLAADGTGRVHTRFLLHVTNTGRLSSRDPNLQNIPTRTDRGRLIRRGFIPRDGCRLISVDLDQIELRVAAHMSQDDGLIDVFNTGKDIHRATAALIYGIPMEQITAQQRLLAKTINFLILYGGGAGRLNSELALLGITTTKDQCVGYINDWFKAYPGVKEYISRCHDQARSAGYVECLYGRRRYVPGVWSCIEKVKEESLKWATNFPIQATAAALLKIWLRRIWDNVLPEFSGYCEPLLTIHDEIIFEAEEGLEDRLIARVVEEAALAANLLVPIKAKGTSAYNWSELK